ncbi:MAG TPA: plastocyanin/azurin family copper-binding protein [bacterium]|nr:plastocyanin/azurin family copper-binding protein [bacterium]
MRQACTAILALVLTGAAVLNPVIPRAPVEAAGPTVTIPGDSYLPPSIMIDAGQTVTWINKDTDPHVTTTMPGTPASFTLVHPPGKPASFKFTTAGIYPYYCLDHATFNTTLRRAAARKEADTFPVAMEGLIVVKGPELTGMPSATVKISGDTYAPDIAVVRVGGKVTWINADRAAHTAIFTGGGAPKLTIAAGKSGSATFAKPGIYFFYDERFAMYNTKLGLAAAKKGAPHFPVAMQGYVVVL